MPEEKKRKTNLPNSSRGKRIITIVLGVAIVILIISASLNVYYYNLSQTLLNDVEGATLEVSEEFYFAMNNIASTLSSQATSENIPSLITALQYHMQTAWRLMRTLRIYLVPTYENQLQTIEDLLTNMTVGGYGGVSDTFSNLQGQGNITLLIQAFQELNATASQKINEVGLEIREAFVSVRRNHVVETFTIDASKIEDAVSAADDLKDVLDEWITKYS
jgi:hypothetical protein